MLISDESGKILINFIVKYLGSRKILCYDSEILLIIKRLEMRHINSICVSGLRDKFDKQAIYNFLDKKNKEAI